MKIKNYSYHKIITKSNKVYYLILQNYYIEDGELVKQITTIFYLNDDQTLQFICSPDYKVSSNITISPEETKNPMIKLTEISTSNPSKI